MDRQEGDTRQYVVYTLDEDANPVHFLGVADSVDEAEMEMNRWWKAFYEERKTTPENYGGVSLQHVSNFEQWEDGPNAE